MKNVFGSEDDCLVKEEFGTGISGEKWKWMSAGIRLVV